MERKDLIKVWDDRNIESGDKWQSEIEASLNDAKVALLDQRQLAFEFKEILQAHQGRSLLVRSGHAQA